MQKKHNLWDMNVFIMKGPHIILIFKQKKGLWLKGTGGVSCEEDHEILKNILLDVKTHQARLNLSTSTKIIITQILSSPAHNLLNGQGYKWPLFMLCTALQWTTTIGVTTWKIKINSQLQWMNRNKKYIKNFGFKKKEALFFLFQFRKWRERE